MEIDAEFGHLVRLAPLFTDRDAFVILYDLAGREKPVTIPFLAKAYGIDPREMRAILQKLIHLRFATKRGSAFTGTRDALRAVTFLDEELRDVNLQASPTESSINASSVVGTYANGTPGVVAAQTTNGTWMTTTCSGIVLSSVSFVEKARDSLTGSTATVNEIREGEVTPDATEARDNAYL